MTTLATTFAGLHLENPIIISSCGLTDSPLKNQQFSEAGAGAIVLKSLFQEQIMMEALWQGDANMYPEGSDYLVEYIRDHRLEEYLYLIRESKRLCQCPIIASINCYKENDWMDFATHFDLLTSGALLGGLSYSVTSDDSISIPEMDTSKNIYDINSEEEISAYSENLSEDSLDFLFENLAEAGVSEETISQILSLFSESTTSLESVA